MTPLEFPNVLRLAKYCGISVYDWQARIVLEIDDTAEGKRIKFAVRAPNGVGKTQRIICLAAARWMQRFPKGRVIVTSFDARQIDDQFWPAFRRLLSKFPDWHAVEAQHKVDTPQGGRLRAFTTDDPGRAEGFHRDDSSPLLVIIDEAKSIPAQILQAVDRCSYNVLLYIHISIRKRLMISSRLMGPIIPSLNRPFTVSSWIMVRGLLISWNFPS